jgi:hypothetical protein
VRSRLRLLRAFTLASSFVLATAVPAADVPPVPARAKAAADEIARGASAAEKAFAAEVAGRGKTPTWDALRAETRTRFASVRPMSAADLDRVAYLAFVRGLEGRHTVLTKARLRVPTPAPTTPPTHVKVKAKTTKGAFDAASKDLEAQDKLGNFEIQDLMSQYNQAETLASSVRKKADQTTTSIIGKI